MHGNSFFYHAPHEHGVEKQANLVLGPTGFLGLGYVP